jgi:hypothetical protein
MNTLRYSVFLAFYINLPLTFLLNLNFTTSIYCYWLDRSGYFETIVLKMPLTIPGLQVLKPKSYEII